MSKILRLYFMVERKLPENLFFCVKKAQKKGGRQLSAVSWRSLGRWKGSTSNCRSQGTGSGSWSSNCRSCNRSLAWKPNVVSVGWGLGDVRTTIVTILFTYTILYISIHNHFQESAMRGTYWETPTRRTYSIQNIPEPKRRSLRKQRPCLCL